MRLSILALTLSFLSAAAMATEANWHYLEGKDAVATKATSHSLSAGTSDAPNLVVVCNNLVRLTYLDWPTDFGVDRKQLPSHMLVHYDLGGGGADDQRTQSVDKDIWTISQPSLGRTYVITHDMLLPAQLTRNATMSLQVEARDNLPQMSASFSLERLHDAMQTNRLACTEEDRFFQRNRPSPSGPVSHGPDIR